MNEDAPDPRGSDIQIVDDNPENLNILASMLKKKGYEARVAINGELALKSIRSHSPDLILLDILMPGMSGFEVCKLLKAEEPTRDIPIIFVSALSDTTDKIAAFSMGGVDYITKPFQEEEVLARVETHLTLRRVQKRLETQNDALQREIIERKRAEEERLHFQRRLQQAQKAESLGRMVGAVAHHFNNLLQVVSGNLEFIRDDLPLHGDAVESLNDAEDATRKAADLGRLMLTYVGQGVEDCSPLDFSDEASRAVPLVVNAMPANIRTRCDFTPRLPAVKVGPDDVRRIVMNLMENAREAMEGRAGTVRISTGKTVCDRKSLERAAWVEANEPGEYVYLDVADEGCGMDPETIERMFDPFFTTKFTGRGLGLSSVAGIVRANQGAIVVTSRPGEGALIRVLFPAAGEPISSVEPMEESAPEELPARGVVLLAEDEPVVRLTCKNMLKRLGFDVLTAADGAEAVEVFRENKKIITAVVCDLSMPRMDGWDTLRAIDGISPGVPVILASGYNEAEVMAGAQAVLPRSILHKPYQVAKLKTALAKALAKPLK
ncbi:MAG: response regulator [Desulfobacterales bacterium]|nr:response regulator [Desulfobacterales bacterium]